MANSSFNAGELNGGLANLSDQIGTKVVSTGIAGVTARVSGNVVTLACDFSSNPISVSAGDVVSLGTLPNELKHGFSTAICGNAFANTTNGRKMCSLYVTATGVLMLASDTAIIVSWASITYIRG